jgi:hypothetical protein
MTPEIVEIATAIVVLTGATKLFVPKKYTILVAIFWATLATIFYGLDPVSIIISVATAAGVYEVGNGFKKEPLAIVDNELDKYRI